MRYLLFAISCVLLLQSCSASIKTFKVEGNKTENGIPFYLPMPYLLVKESIEIERKEDLFYAIRLNNVKTYFLPVSFNYDQVESLISNSNLSASKDSAYIIYQKSYSSNTKGENIVQTWDAFPLNNKVDSYTAMRDYTPSSGENSFQIVMLPDFKNKYELKICSGTFSSIDVKFEITDGWRFDGFEANISENKLISSLTDVTKGIIEAAKDIKTLEIEQAAAIKLQEFDNDISTLFTSTQNESYEFLGYFKKITVTTIPPGIYRLFDDENKIAMPNTTKTDTYYMPFRF